MLKSICSFTWAFTVALALTWFAPTTVQSQTDYSDATAQAIKNLTAQAIKNLNESLGHIDASYAGQPQPLKNAIAAFVSTQMQGSLESIRLAQDRMCVEWRARSPNQPFTGEIALGPVTFSLDKTCGIERKTTPAN